jgi:hypothetical protein
MGLATMPDSCCVGLMAKPDQRLGSGGQQDPSLLGRAPNMTASSRLGLTPNMVARSKQITKEKGQLCTLIVGREKGKKKMQTIDNQQQSNHDMSTHATPCVRGHVFTSI